MSARTRSRPRARPCALASRNERAQKLVSALLVLTLAVSGGLLAWHGLHRTSAAPPVGQTQTPTVPAPPASVPDTVSTLCVAGDLVMHIPIINSCRTDDGYDFTGLFDEARPYYESADYAAACIETTFNGPPYSGFPQFCAPDQLAGDLKSVGLDLLSTASNHSLDTWFSGLTRTLDVLDGAGLDHVGTYRTQEERDTVKVIDVGGIRLAVLAYTYGTNGLPKDEHPYCVNVFTTDYMTNCGEIDYELLKSDLARAHQTDADAIAVFMHWGQEYATSPPPSSASWRIFCSRTARRLCSAAMSMCRSRWSCASCPTDAPAFCATVSAI